jgi:hypothetical protein
MRLRLQGILLKRRTAKKALKKLNGDWHCNVSQESGKLHNRDGTVTRSESGFIQNREPHLHEEEGSVENRTEKGGSEQIIQKE